VLTHTRPWPPPCAGALVAGSVTAGFAGAGLAAAGLAAAGAADADVFGLKKLPSENLLGDAEGTGLAATSVFAFLRLRFSAGDAEATAVLSAAAGEAAVVASAFLCERRFPGDGDASGDSAGEGDAASSAGEAFASAFLCARRFVGDGDAAGDSAGEGDTASSAGEAVASASLCARCFAGEGDAVGVGD
jgi:hypothetical protein